MNLASFKCLFNKQIFLFLLVCHCLESALAGNPIRNGLPEYGIRDCHIYVEKRPVLYGGDGNSSSR